MSGRYVKQAEKTEYVLRQVLVNGPLSLAELAESFMRDYGMKFSTARASASDTVWFLLDHGVLAFAGYRRGSRVVELTATGYTEMAGAILGGLVSSSIGAGELERGLERRGLSGLAPYLRLFERLASIGKPRRPTFGSLHDYIASLTRVGEPRPLDYSSVDEGLRGLCVIEVMRILGTPELLYELYIMAHEIDEALHKPLYSILHAVRVRIEKNIDNLTRLHREVNRLIETLIERRGDAW